MIRTYICDNCEHEFCISQGMHDSLKKKCPQCKKYTLYQDLSGQHSFVYQDPTTLKHLAERNTKSMGKTKFEEIEANSTRHQEKEKRKSWYNKDGKDLTKELKGINTPEKKQKYIMTGEK